MPSSRFLKGRVLLHDLIGFVIGWNAIADSLEKGINANAACCTHSLTMRSTGPIDNQPPRPIIRSALDGSRRQDSCDTTTSPDSLAIILRLSASFISRCPPTFLTNHANDVSIRFIHLKNGVVFSAHFGFKFILCFAQLLHKACRYPSIGTLWKYTLSTEIRR